MYAFLSKYNKDFYGGGLMFVLGTGAIWQGLSYQVGSLRKMGPGFFPVALGAILALMGIVMLVNGKRAAPSSAELQGLKNQSSYEWRGWICIASGIVAFIVLGKYGGLLPASFAIVFISALGDRENTIKSTLVLSLAIVLVCVIVFWWALQMQFPLFRWGSA